MLIITVFPRRTTAAVRESEMATTSSEYMFGPGHGRLTDQQAKQAERVAQEHGCDFAGNPNIPGRGRIFWFTTSWAGGTFGAERRERACMEALRMISPSLWEDRELGMESDVEAAESEGAGR